MKYRQGSFITVPNKDLLDGQPPYVQTLFMWLCHYANATGECFPSYATLCANTGVKITTLKKGMGILLKLGMIEKEAQYVENRQTTNMYVINIVGRGRHTTPRGVATRRGEGSPDVYRTQFIGTQSQATQKRKILTKRDQKIHTQIIQAQMREILDDKDITGDILSGDF